MTKLPENNGKNNKWGISPERLQKILDSRPEVGHTAIPPRVRYSTEVSWFDKVLYGEVENLTHAKGYAWVTNMTLAVWLNVTVRGIQQSLRNLVDAEFIDVHFDDGRRMISIKTQAIQIDEGVNSGSSNETQIEKQIKKQTHTQQKIENGKPVSEGVCDFENLEKEDVSNEGSPSNIPVNAEKKEIKSSAKKKEKRSLEDYLANRGITIYEMPKQIKTSVIQYWKWMIENAGTEGARENFQSEWNKFCDQVTAGMVVAYYVDKAFEDGREAAMIPPNDDRHSLEFQKWFNGIWRAVCKTRDTFKQKRGIPTGLGHTRSKAPQKRPQNGAGATMPDGARKKRLLDALKHVGPEHADIIKQAKEWAEKPGADYDKILNWVSTSTRTPTEDEKKAVQEARERLGLVSA